MRRPKSSNTERWLLIALVLAGALLGTALTQVVHPDQSTYTKPVKEMHQIYRRDGHWYWPRRPFYAYC